MAQYPYVVVRVACDLCPRRRGSYRLARLAEKFGAETPLPDVLEQIALDCRYPSPRKVRGNQYAPRCHVHFPDLWRPDPPPPDVPLAMTPSRSRLRLVGGGKA